MYPKADQLFYLRWISCILFNVSFPIRIWISFFPRRCPLPLTVSHHVPMIIRNHWLLRLKMNMETFSLLWGLLLNPKFSVELQRPWLHILKLLFPTNSISSKHSNRMEWNRLGWSVFWDHPVCWTPLEHSKRKHNSKICEPQQPLHSL